MEKIKANKHSIPESHKMKETTETQMPQSMKLDDQNTNVVTINKIIYPPL